MNPLKTIILIIILFMSKTYAQSLSTAQSSPEISWHEISNDFVQLIYPNFLESDSIYIANLIKYNSKLVGQTYSIEKPDKITIVLRSEVAEANGFVTLGPRRSEWYSPGGISPFVGTSEWYQTLAIHEYRHVLQYDHYNQNTVKFLDYFMGDTGIALGIFFGLQPWYFEGDAVWAETKYTDAGRGRSPRFLSRLKALVLSERIPTYDEFVNGSYNTKLPNHYVFGYVLISSATQKYGEKFWAELTRGVSKFPHPRKFYSVFREISGSSFEVFYNQTMQELKDEWSQDSFTKPLVANKKEYEEIRHIHKTDTGTFYLKTTLDHQPTIYKKMKQKDKPIIQIPYNASLNQLHIAFNKGVITQFLPHPRFDFKGYSDVILIDLENGTSKQITKSQRLYNPQLNKAATKIIAVEFTAEHSWKIVELSLDGKIIQSFELDKSFEPSEVNYLDDQTISAIVNSRSGEKALVVIDLVSKKIMNTLLSFSRNSIHSLFSDSNKNIVFEAQYKGREEIFSFSNKGQLSKCSESKIGSYMPSIYKSELFYSQIDLNGFSSQSVRFSDCIKFDVINLIDYNYLGDSPSDNYNNFSSKKLDNQIEYYSKNKENLTPTKHSDFNKRLITPHSWSFIGGNGFALSVQSDNYLGTVGLMAQIGSSAAENQSYSEIGITYNKYWPMFKFNIGDKRRLARTYDSNDETDWREKTAELNMYVPYTFKKGLFNFQTLGFIGASYIDASDYNFNTESLDEEDNHYQQSSIGAQFIFSKDPVFRSLRAPWLLSYDIEYNNSENISKEMSNAYQVHHALKVQTPGAYEHHSFYTTFNHQDEKGEYEFLPAKMNSLGYSFSRGYQYENVPGFQKLTANYLLPIAYPDYNLAGWYYLRRMSVNLFYDSTLLFGIEQRVQMESYGTELELESKILRIIPLNFGVRVLKKVRDDSNLGEIYIATDLAF